MLPGRLEEKRKELAIDPYDETPDATAGTTEAGRRVPPPSVPGHGPPGSEAAGPGAFGREPPGVGHAWPDAPPALAAAERGGTERAWSGTGGSGWPAPGLSAGTPHQERPPSKAAQPGQPFYLPRADWRWAAAVAGLLAGAAPQILLQLASTLAGDTSSSAGSVTTASAIAIAASSLVLYGWQALAAWLFSLYGHGRSLLLWGFRRPTRSFWWVVPAGLAGVYAAGIVHDIIVNPKQQAIVSAFPRTAIGVAMFTLVAVILAPVFEEIVFRGFLFRGLANSFGWVWGALLSAAVFGAAHLQLDVFLPLAALGFVLAWAYHRTGSLWTTITMHALFNSIAVLAWALTG